MNKTAYQYFTTAENRGQGLFTAARRCVMIGL
jgi:hypothetical protein